MVDEWILTRISHLSYWHLNYYNLTTAPFSIHQEWYNNYSADAICSKHSLRFYHKLEWILMHFLQLSMFLKLPIFSNNLWAQCNVHESHPDSLKKEGLSDLHLFCTMLLNPEKYWVSDFGAHDSSFFCFIVLKCFLKSLSTVKLHNWWWCSHQKKVCQQLSYNHHQIFFQQFWSLQLSSETCKNCLHLCLYPMQCLLNAFCFFLWNHNKNAGWDTHSDSSVQGFGSCNQ